MVCGIIDIEINRRNLPSDIEGEWLMTGELHSYSFTDTYCIEHLILNRSKLDSGWGLDIDAGRDVYHTEGTASINSDVTATYTTLDDLIKRAKFLPEQKLLLYSLMDGNTLADVSNLIMFKPRHIIDSMFKNCVQRIKKVNDDLHEDWLIRNKLTRCETKFCSMCGRERLIDNFYLKKYAKDGRQKICKDCRSEIEKERYRENVK